MQIDKSQILDLLRSQGKSDQAADADAQLPDQVDTDDDSHKDLLSKLGVDLGSLGGLGGIGKLLG